MDRVAARTCSCPRAAGLHLLLAGVGKVKWRQPNDDCMLLADLKVQGCLLQTFPRM